MHSSCYCTCTSKFFTGFLQSQELSPDPDFPPCTAGKFSAVDGFSYAILYLSVGEERVHSLQEAGVHHVALVQNEADLLILAALAMML